MRPFAFYAVLVCACAVLPTGCADIESEQPLEVQHRSLQCEPRDAVFSVSDTVERGQWLYYGPFEALGDASTDLFVRGDADVFVAEGARPTERTWDCRSDRSDPDKRCISYHDGDVYLAVYGYYRSDFDLFFQYRTPDSSCPDEDDLISNATFGSGSVNEDEWDYYGPYVVPPDHVFTVYLSGTGDADLYVRRDTLPTESSYDCRSYNDGSSEHCSLNSSDTDTTVFYIGVHGYSSSTSIYSFSASVTQQQQEVSYSGATATYDGWMYYGPFDMAAYTDFTANFEFDGTLRVYINRDDLPSDSNYDEYCVLNTFYHTCTFSTDEPTEVYVGITSSHVNEQVDYSVEFIWQP